MKNIEFRAWDIEKQQWIYFSINRFPSEPQIIKIPKQVKIYLWTGLKDCKGIKIYEGDIIQNRQHWIAGKGFYSKETYKSEVIFKDGSWFLKDVGCLWAYNSPYLKIIGNIYQK